MDSGYMAARMLRPGAPAGGSVVIGFQMIHIVIGEAEMMADFVNQGIADEGLEIFAGLAPVIEQGTAIEEDAVDVLGRVADAFLIEGNPMIEAEQIERALELHFGLGFGVGKFLDQDNHIVQMAAQAQGYAVERALGYGVNVRGGRRLTERLLHGATIARRKRQIKRGRRRSTPL